MMRVFMLIVICLMIGGCFQFTLANKKSDECIEFMMDISVCITSEKEVSNDEVKDEE